MGAKHTLNSASTPGGRTVIPSKPNLFAPSISIICVLAGSAAYATGDGPDRFRVRDVRTDDTLTVRAQPSGSARKVAALPPDARGIENLGCVDGRTGQDASDVVPKTHLWCKIRIGSLIGWASARFLSEDTEILKPYSVSHAPSGPGQFTATSTAIEKTMMGDSRWRVKTQTVVSGATSRAVPDEVTMSLNLVDCRRGRSEVIRLGGDTPGYVTAIEDVPKAGFEPDLASFDEYNLWWGICRDVRQKYRWQ